MEKIKETVNSIAGTRISEKARQKWKDIKKAIEDKPVDIRQLKEF